MSGGTVIAAGAPAHQTGGRRVLGLLGDLLLAIIVVLALPVALAITAGLVRLVIAVFTGSNLSF